MGKASIIIVSYNGLDTTTAPCLDSLFRETDYDDYEVIVVDNNSTDNTPNYLRDLASREPRLKLVLNQSNRGFAGGNNDGIRVASGEFLVLLNSDTLVTKGWLTNMVGALREDSAIGLVGPVSNSAGNEQTIFTRGNTLEQVIAEGMAWTSASRGDRFECQRLCFFCVATRRDVIAQIGMLDESFGIGFYEDDDYCIRARRGGYRLVCLEDVFVYHQGSASFAAMNYKTKALLKQNKRLLEAKFKIKYRYSHPRDRQFELIDSYLERLKGGEDGDALRFKIANRLRQVESLRPRGILKRFIFNSRLRAITRVV
jgi:GT2 family glycosyltransferase